MEIYEFDIPFHTTRREWAVYVIKAQHRATENIMFYVGKVGDNRAGCNPIISRIGNHFSHNMIHSQMRNKILEVTGSATTDYNYTILYSTFGEYIAENQLMDRDKVNELERQLNRYIQENLKNSLNFTILNPYKGIGVSKKTKNERSQLLTEKEKETLKALADRATN